jgi:aminopeptidase
MSKSKFKPKKEILEKYADVLVNFALGSGEGIKEKETVYLQFDADALDLGKEVYKAILNAEAYPIERMSDEDFVKIKFDTAKDHQLEFFPEKYLKALVDTMDHRIALIASRNPLLLKSIDPKKISLSRKKSKKMRKWLDAKEDTGDYTWTLCRYATEGMAKEAGLTLKEYWEQIIKACYLDKPDPIKKWREVFDSIEEIRRKLTEMPIEKIHLEAQDTNLWMTLGKKRKWVGGSGRNIPSFEIFTSPDWRGTNGHIKLDLPLYHFGNIIKDIYLEFKDGKVTKFKAGKNENVLKEIINQENADKIGEFSLTDKKFSRIDKFMANTLYDENYGGKYGNTHIALGASYHDTYEGDSSKVTDKDWEELGYNESPEHSDIIATTRRTVTAVLKNGEEKVIYENGSFLL